MHVCTYVCMCVYMYITVYYGTSRCEEEGKQENEKELGKKKRHGMGWSGARWSTMARGGEADRRMLEIAKDKEPRTNERNWLNHVLETSRRRELNQRWRCFIYSKFQVSQKGKKENPEFETFLVRSKREQKKRRKRKHRRKTVDRY